VLRELVGHAPAPADKRTDCPVARRDFLTSEGHALRQPELHRPPVRVIVVEMFVVGCALVVAAPRVGNLGEGHLR
jgi:hypothetical protein